MFDVNQILELDDTIYDTNTEEIYAQIATADQIVVQGNMMGWTKMSGIVIELEATFTLTTPTGLTIGINDNPGYPYGYQSTGLHKPVWNLLQPDFALLQPIKRFQIAIGENNTIIQRQTMNYTEGLKHVARNRTSEIQDISIVGNSGLPFSRTFRNVKTTADFDNTVFGQSSDMTSDYIKNWDQILNEIIMAATVGSAPGVTSYTTKFSVPLCMLNSVFNSGAWLKAGTKFRIEIEPESSIVEIARSRPLNYTIDATSFMTLGMTLNRYARLVYRRHQARQPVQLALNEALLRQPMLINYNTQEYVEILTDGTTTRFVKDIAISQQRPTQVTFVVYGPSVITDIDTGILPFLPADGSDTVKITCYPKSIVPANYLNPIVYIAGRQNYYLRTTKVFSTSRIQQGYLLDGTDMLNKFTQNGTYMTEGVNNRMNASKMYGSFAEGNQLVISINPGDTQQHGKLSTDQGAVVVRVEFTAVLPASDGLPFPAGFKIRIYKDLPEQLQIDAAGNVTIITWPAVSTSSGFALPLTTNMNG